jgi:glutamyl endopeptidase
MTTMLDEIDELLGYELDSEVIGKDTRVRVKNTTVGPYRYICQLEYNGRDEAFRCSGTLIGPRTVLTAGHCIRQENGRVLTTPANMVVTPGRNGSTKPFGSARAAKFIPFTAPAGADGTDIGIIQLATPIGLTAGYWTRIWGNSKVDPIGRSLLRGSLPVDPGKQKVNLSGYPGDKPLGTAWRSYNFTKEISGGVLSYVNDTYGGHSGCPVWVRRAPENGGRVLVAVHVAGSRAAGRNYGVLISSDILKFIIANTK